MRRPRVLIYGSVLLAISVAFVASLALRSPLKVDVVRDRGALARIVDGGRIENVYRLQLMNATEAAQRYRISATGLEGIEAVVSGDVEIGPAQARWVPVAERVPHAAAEQLAPGAHAIHFVIASQDARGVRVEEKSTFVIPR